MMAAAYLLAPDVPTLTIEFAGGCSGKLRQSRTEAHAATARRRRGIAYPCKACGGWHTTRADGPPVPRWRAPGLVRIAADHGATP